MTQHLDEGLLHSLLDGEVPSGELPALEAHLASCPECRARLEEARAFRDEAERLVAEIDLAPEEAGQEVAPHLVPIRRKPLVQLRPLAFAATLLLAVGIGFAAYAVLGYQVRAAPDGSSRAEIPGAVQPTAPDLNREIETGVTGARGRTGRQLAGGTPDPRTSPAGPGQGPTAPRESAPAGAPSAKALAAATEPAAQEPSDSLRQALARTARESAAVEARRVATLAGRVAGRDGQAIAGATVLVAGTSVSARTGSDGTYRLEGDLPPEVEVVARALGYRADRKRVSTAADSGRADFALQPEPVRLEEIVAPLAAREPARAMAAAPPTPPRFRAIGFPEAVRLLGGRIRLVDGMVPERLEAAGDTVRISYRLGPGSERLYLQQFRVGDTVAFALLPPPGFPADSLARLTARVKP